MKPTDIEQIELTICPHNPAPYQLVARGFFPCTPIALSLAVSIPLLEFNHECFLRLALNVTGWCGAVESFLKGRKYKGASVVCVRQHLQKS
jgi:hypothetical protein